MNSAFFFGTYLLLMEQTQTKILYFSHNVL